MKSTTPVPPPSQSRNILRSDDEIASRKVTSQCYQRVSEPASEQNGLNTLVGMESCLLEESNEATTVMMITMMMMIDD